MLVKTFRPACAAAPLFVLMMVCAAALGACAASKPAGTPAAARPTPSMPPSVVAADLADRSVLRLRLRKIPGQAWRVVEPHWTRIPPYNRGALQLVLFEVFDEKKLIEPAADRLAAAVAADPALAVKALEWLRSPLASELKFVEATAARTDLGRRDLFLEKFAQVSDDGGPQERMSRIRDLVEATGAIAATLDVTQAVGTAAARLVNASLIAEERLSGAELETIVRRERGAPEVTRSYQPVVHAGLLYRYRELSLAELDEYVAFARSDAGRWYHRVLTEAVIAAVGHAAKDLGETALLANAGARPVFDPEEALLALPSGRSVRVLGMTGIEMDARPAMILRYETFLTLNDAVAVRNEAGEVWERVRGDIEKAGGRAVVLQATGSVRGWVFPSASTRSYSWRREHDGVWKLLSAAASGADAGGVQRETLWSLAP